MEKRGEKNEKKIKALFLSFDIELRQMRVQKDSLKVV